MQAISNPDKRTNTRFAEAVPATFDGPEKLPASEDEAREWQLANRAFWESNPMRYDWKENIRFPQGTREFYEEIDRRFFENAAEYLPPSVLSFGHLIPFGELAGKDVLEIGVGMGSHAGLLSAHAGTYTGIDLTQYAVDVTTDRMRVFGREADIRRMDAEELDFPDASFDFIWSWGVVHHSSNTARILMQMERVLKPGGHAVVMVYNRGWWNYYMCGGFIGGLLRGRVFTAGSLARSIQQNTDGALARYYSRRSWRRFASRYLEVDKVTVTGPKSDLLPIPAGRFKRTLSQLLPVPVARFMTGRLGMGGMLIAELSKR